MSYKSKGAYIFGKISKTKVILVEKAPQDKKNPSLTVENHCWL